MKQINKQPGKKRRIDQEFARIVKRRLKNNLKKIILFGSHARGDYTDSSDYDILVIVDKKNRSTQDMILDACVEIMDNYYELIGCIVCDEKEWEMKKRFPIGLNILREGIEL
jgi:predicted nucleotidyltransferase